MSAVKTQRVVVELDTEGVPGHGWGAALVIDDDCVCKAVGYPSKRTAVDAVAESVGEAVVAALVRAKASNRPALEGVGASEVVPAPSEEER